MTTPPVEPGTPALLVRTVGLVVAALLILLGLRLLWTMVKGLLLLVLAGGLLCAGVLIAFRVLASRSRP